MGYPRIEREKDSILVYNNEIFSFGYPSSAQIENIIADQKDERWLNIHYPQYKATIHCSYIPITKKTLSKAMEDNHRIIYSHAAQASDIQQTLISNIENNSSGILYDIRGNVASPIQFFLTDSTKHFFRGSLYYDNKVNPDSVAPITSFIREDIVRIAATMVWNIKPRQ
jgi:gliding motility-associated lipoprotein GldD